MNKAESGIEHGYTPEEQEVQDRLHQIFTRCGRLIEQAELIMPEERHQPEEYILKQYGTLKHPNPSYLFIFPDGRRNHIFGRRTKDVDGLLVRTDDFWSLKIEFDLGLRERLKLRLPKNVALEMKKTDDGSIDAELIDFSASAMGKLIKGEDISSVAPQIAILEKCVKLLSTSPSHVTDYLAKDVRNFNSPSV